MRAASANMAVHVSWVQKQTAGMSVQDDSELLVADCGLPCDTFNVVCRARLKQETAPARIRSVIDHYTGRPFCWWLNPGDLPDDLGALLRAEGDEVAMGMDLDQLAPAGRTPEGFQVERVQTAEGLRDFARIVAANWTPPDSKVERFFERAAPVVLPEDSPLWIYVGYVEGVPVAASQLTIGGQVAGLYNVCALAHRRQRGYGSVLTRQPLLDAREHGHRTAILQAAPDGVGIYTRLGFEPFRQVIEYKLPQQ